MKLTSNTAIKTFTSDGVESSVMGVDIETADLITSYLRDKIYTDKHTAPIREYICNAVDSHGYSNVDKWVDVSIRVDQSGQSIWSVRDYGEGLDDNDVRTVFGIYGKSTKRDSQKLIGCFGVGAMSGFAYTDTFYVASYHKGVKTSYICSLGAGKFGVEVGEIFEVGKEPTLESGIEVSFDVTQSLTKFVTKTRNFIMEMSPGTKARFKYKGEVTIPLVPRKSKEIDGFVYNVYDAPEGLDYDSNLYPLSSSNVIIRMGGVIYSPSIYCRLEKALAINGIMIVDVPLGTITLPISREAYETTETNKRKLSPIKDAIKQLEEEDVESSPEINFSVFLKSQKRNLVDVGWFSFNSQDLYPEFVKMWSSVAPSTGHSKQSIINSLDHVILYIFPDIKNPANWHKRLDKFIRGLNSTGTGEYLWTTIRRYDDLFVGAENQDVPCIDIKDLKLPKLEKIPIEKTSYRVYHGYGKGFYTPDDLEKRANNSYEIDWDSVDVETWWDKPDLTFSELNSRLIGTLSEMSSSRHAGYRASSKKLIETMQTLGWIAYGSTKHTAALNIIEAREQTDRIKQDINNTIKGWIFGKSLSPKSLSIIINNPIKYQIRFDQLHEKLKSEKTLRGTVTKLWDRAYSWEKPNITKDEFTKILKLKIKRRI